MTRRSLIEVEQDYRTRPEHALPPGFAQEFLDRFSPSCLPWPGMRRWYSTCHYWRCDTCLRCRSSFVLDLFLYTKMCLYHFTRQVRSLAEASSGGDDQIEALQKELVAARKVSNRRVGSIIRQRHGRREYRLFSR